MKLPGWADFFTFEELCHDTLRLITKSEILNLNWEVKRPEPEKILLTKERLREALCETILMYDHSEVWLEKLFKELGFKL